MAETARDRAEAVRGLLAETANADEGVQKAALEAMAPAPVPAPDQGAANKLWTMLVAGLLVLTAIALVGLLIMVGDGDDETSPDLVVAVFSSLLTGLLGLFIKSPMQSSQ